MKWFKHDTGARNDTRIKLLKKRFGVEGYGIYFQLLEIVGENIKDNNQDQWSFVEAIHTKETLADEIGVRPDKLASVLEYCNEIGLLFQIDGKLCIPKILDRLDEYATRRKKDFDISQRKTDLAGQSRDNVGTQSGQYRVLEKKRKEQKRKEPPKPPTGVVASDLISLFNDLFDKKYTLTEKRRRFVGDRLKAFEPDQLEQAVKNLAQSPFHRGKNDRGWTADPDYLFRSDENVDKALNMGVSAGKSRAKITDPLVLAAMGGDHV